MLIYDIEVFDRMNLIGFLTEDNGAIWVVNAKGFDKDTTLDLDGNTAYINHGTNPAFVRSLLTGAQTQGIPYGFNNHGYDDFLIDDIAAGLDTHAVKMKSDNIIKFRPRIFFDWESYDTKEQLPPSFSLKKWESMRGLTVDESSIPFDYAGTFTEEQLIEVLKYNLFDMEATMKLAEERKNYFNGKTLLVNEYGWKGSGRYSNGSISAHFLMGKERLEGFKGQPHISLDGIPEDAQAFLSRALVDSPKVSRETSKTAQTALKRDMEVQLTTEAMGNVFTWGWGGLHSAAGSIRTTPRGKQKPVFTHATYTDVQQWDVASMFPNIIIRDNLLGDATAKFKKLVTERLKNKREGNPLAATQKIVVNAVYGLLRLPSSRLFNPESAIAVNVAGMVAVYNLAARLSKHGTIIQVNTDGIAFKPNENTTQDELDALREGWEAEYKLELEVSHFSRLIQRDVNNYIAETPDGHIKLKGGAVSRALKQDYTKNTSPRVIQTAVVQSLLHDVPLAETITNGSDPLDYCFTLSSVKSALQTGRTVKVVGDKLTPLENKVNRVYAAMDGVTLKKERKDGSAAIFPDSPETMGIANGSDLSQVLDNIDFAYYLDLAKQKLAQWK